MYKMMLSDLDETLIVNHRVPLMNQEAINKLQAKGIKFVPASGRAYDTLVDVLRDIGTYDKEDEYCICFNGGLIAEVNIIRCDTLSRLSYSANAHPIHVVQPGYRIVPRSVGDTLKMSNDSRMLYNIFMADTERLLKH